MLNSRHRHAGPGEQFLSVLAASAGVWTELMNTNTTQGTSDTLYKRETKQFFLQNAPEKEYYAYLCKLLDRIVICTVCKPSAPRVLRR